ncbi:MAG: hypothetical protein KKH75_03665, partial [Actinobacteria bacterium]|nr:hypothetical protein [Actinomycetota bacterium]
DASGVGFRRAGDRRAPYNVMGNTSVLLQRAGGSVKPGDPGFRFGPQLTGGRSGSVVRTAWPASRIVAAVEPVDTISTPAPASASASRSRSVLSLTDTSARRTGTTSRSR